MSQPLQVPNSGCVALPTAQYQRRRQDVRYQPAIEMYTVCFALRMPRATPVTVVASGMPAEGALLEQQLLRRKRSAQLGPSCCHQLLRQKRGAQLGPSCCHQNGAQTGVARALLADEAIPGHSLPPHNAAPLTCAVTGKVVPELAWEHSTRPSIPACQPMSGQQCPTPECHLE